MSSGASLSSGWDSALARETHASRLEFIKAAEAAARRICPVDTGALVQTIEGEADVDTMACRLSAGNEQVDYATYVELGTIHQQPQPYLRPAIHSVGG